MSSVLADFKRKDAAAIIRRILVTLRQAVPDERDLEKYLTQLDLLSHIRKYNSIVINEIDNMAFTYDIKRDARYQQGIEQGAHNIARESLKKTVLVFS